MLAMIVMQINTYQWSEDYIKKYYGERKKFNYGSVLSEGYLQKEGADTNLIHLIKSDLYPEIVRATAIQYLSALSEYEDLKRINKINAG